MLISDNITRFLLAIIVAYLKCNGIQQGRFAYCPTLGEFLLFVME